MGGGGASGLRVETPWLLRQFKRFRLRGPSSPHLRHLVYILISIVPPTMIFFIILQGDLVRRRDNHTTHPIDREAPSQWVPSPGPHHLNLMDRAGSMQARHGRTRKDRRWWLLPSWDLPAGADDPSPDADVHAAPAPVVVMACIGHRRGRRSESDGHASSIVVRLSVEQGHGGGGVAVCGGGGGLAFTVVDQITAPPSPS